MAYQRDDTKSAVANLTAARADALQNSAVTVDNSFWARKSDGYEVQTLSQNRKSND